MSLLRLPLWSFLCTVCSATTMMQTSFKQCSYLSEIPYLNARLARELGLWSGGRYFCAKGSPEQYRCSCDYMERCFPFSDESGRSIGVCGCCHYWLTALVSVMLGISVFALLSFVYAKWWMGRWWLDGFPWRPRWIIPGSRSIIPCPVGQPLPENLFRGYESSDFVTDDANASQKVNRPVAYPPGRTTISDGSTAQRGGNGNPNSRRCEPIIESVEPPLLQSSANLTACHPSS